MSSFTDSTDLPCVMLAETESLMEPENMATVDITIRRSALEDAPALAALHGVAWRSAYRGIIPGITLERMIARRGPDFWRRMQGRGGALILEFEGTAAGYAVIGPNRVGELGAEGEIYELYLAAEYQGAGLGRRLFQAARDELRRQARRGMVVRSLAVNENACGFYAAMGGRRLGRGRERIDGTALATVTYHWR